MSFINSIFLFATAAAAIPVLLHLVRRMKAKTVPFPSLMFLRATPRELVRRRRLKDLLLMAARMAMIVLLALAFARPFIPSEQLPFVPQREAESTVLVVDRSFSMRYGDAFERALRAVRARVDAAQPGDELALIVFSGTADLLAPLSSDRTALQAALGSVQPDFAATDFLPALQRAADVLAEARHRRKVVVLASDFQATGWARAPADWKLPPGVHLEPISVGSAEPANAFVEAFMQSGRRVDGRNAVRYEARIASLGAAAERPHVAALVVDGATVDRTELPARASAPLAFEQFAPREGFFQGAVELSDRDRDADDLADDDRFYFTHRAFAPPVLLVSDAPSVTGRRDAFFLRTAFDLGETSRFRFVHAQSPTAGELRQADVAFVSAPDASPAALRGFVERGGTLLLYPADGANAAAFSRLLEGLDAGRVSEIVDARESLGYEAIIGEVDVRHPLFAPFAGSGSLLRPRFRLYARLVPSDGTTVLGQFDSGDPFLLERRIGSGRLLVYASTLNAGWTDLPLDEMYVPFVYQIAEYGTRRSQDDLVYTIGDDVLLRGDAGSTWEVRAPNGDLFRVELDDDGRGYFREARLPGHYAAANGSDRRLFSVNVDPLESDLATRDAEEVYAAVTAPSSDAPAEAMQAAAVVDDERNQKLWRILLLAVIALFGVETWIANRNDRKRTAAAPPVMRKAA